jgi:hypothetical protein
MMMKARSLRYSLSGLIVATVFWFVDSATHYYFNKDAGFELIPPTSNELWMRSIIFVFIIGFGIYVDLSVNRMRRLYNERYQLQQKLDYALTKLLSGFVSICCECKRVNTGKKHEAECNSWEDVESYISSRTELVFSHGYCPVCEDKVKKEIEGMANTQPPST